MISTHLLVLSGRVRTVIRLKSLTTILLCVFIAVNWGHTGWIRGKAIVAQYLIADAWQQTLITGDEIKPWSWADTWPVARLEFPSLNEHFYVLSGSDGTSLAFGPGHSEVSAPPGETGTTVINGHRDTHFALLAKVVVGDTINVQAISGQWVTYSVSSIEIVDTRVDKWFISHDVNELHLITCYPFNELRKNPPLRYIIIASAQPA